MSDNMVIFLTPRTAYRVLFCAYLKFSAFCTLLEMGQRSDPNFTMNLRLQALLHREEWEVCDIIALVYEEFPGVPGNSGHLEASASNLHNSANLLLDPP